MSFVDREPLEPELQLEIEFFVGSIGRSAQEELHSRIQQAAEWVARKFRVSRLIASISVVDDNTIQKLNCKHLQHDWPTDVISFVFESGIQTSGEIIVSWDTAVRLCQSAGWSSLDELLLYVLHGLLHLAGLDDRESDQRAVMRLTEQEYLRSIDAPGANDYLERFDDVSY